MGEGACFLVREHMAELMQRLSDAEQSTRTLLRGPPESGCSTTLAALVQWARLKGWVVRCLRLAARAWCRVCCKPQCQAAAQRWQHLCSRLA